MTSSNSLGDPASSYGANAHQDSGETLRRRTALRNAHQDKVRMHPYFAI
ncbi:MAG: hypothetical protein HC800_16860 [Phormidesmis sp. RL_2_1]|nr:hypothetical protein [Phormidesmis sp. RL_2_1]